MVKFSIKQPPPEEKVEEVVWELQPSGPTGIRLVVNGIPVFNIGPNSGGLCRRNIRGCLPSCIALTPEGYIATHTEVYEGK